MNIHEGKGFNRSKYDKVTVNVQKFWTLFSFCCQIRAETRKLLVKKANREDPDQTASSKQSDLGLPCLSRLLHLQF